MVFRLKNKGSDFLVTKGNKKAIFLKGAFKPLHIFKNAKEYPNFKTTGTVQEAEEFTGTLDSYITVYGKTGYADSGGDVPSPDNIKEIVNACGKISVSGEKGETTEYQIPELYGIEVSADAPYNYKETVQGVTRYYIADTLEDGKITRRIAKRVVDEKATLRYCTEMGDEYYRIGFSDFYNRLAFVNQHKTSNSIICNMFESRFGYNPEEACYYEHTTSDSVQYYNFQYIVLQNERLSELSVEGSRQWLKDNKPVFYYPLIEPYVEECSISVKSLPKFTRISVSNANSAQKLGLAESIRICDI